MSITARNRAIEGPPSIATDFSPEYLTQDANAPKRLRKLVLALAVRGTLVEQRQPEGTAHDLLVQFGRRSDGREPAVHGLGVSLPASWCWAFFGEVATIESNLVDPKKHLDLPHVAPDNIEKGTGRLLEYRTIREDGVTSSKQHFFPGQILYSKIRPNLSKVVVVDFEGLCSADMYPLSTRIDTRYLQIFLLSDLFLSQVVRDDNRIAMPKVNQQQLSATVIAVPPLAEQKRIVAKVDQLMALCDELEAKQAKKRDVCDRLTKASLAAIALAETPQDLRTSWERVSKNFGALFDSLESIGDLRVAIFDAAIRGILVRQVASEGVAAQTVEGVLEEDRPFNAPSSWGWTTIDSLCRDSFYGPRFAKGDYVTNGGIPTIRTTDMTDAGTIQLKNAPRVLVDPAKLDLYRVQPGDLLITRSGSIGIMAVFEGDFDAIPSAYLIRFRFRHEAVTAKFIFAYLKSSFGRKRLGLASTQMAQPNVNATAIRSIPLALPPLPEQKRILDTVDRLLLVCDDLERALLARNATAERLGESLAATATSLDG